MNRSDLLTDELIQAAFERRADRADRAETDALGEEIVSLIAGNSQRARWVLRLEAARPAPAVRPAWIATVALIALLGLALALVLIGQRPSTPFRTGLLAYVSGGDVYLAHPDGSDAEVSLHQDGVAFTSVAWSPDGSRLAVDGESGAVVLDVATGAASLIGGRDPVWSPDGRQLAVLDSQLRIVDMATGTTSRTYPFSGVGEMAWSPNGLWIAATGGADEENRHIGRGNNGIVRIDVTTGVEVKIDDAYGGLGSPREPVWSPDSRHIAFIRWATDGIVQCNGERECETDVFVAGADGLGAFRLNRVPAEADQPAWSPDGLSVAFRQVAWTLESSADNPGFITSAATGIAIAAADGSAERSIVADAAGVIVWSPEGDRLRVTRHADQGSTESIWEATIDGDAHQLDIATDNRITPSVQSGPTFAWQAIARGRSVPSLPKLAAVASSAPRVFATPVHAAPADPSGTWPTLVSESPDGCQPVTIPTTDTGSTTIADLCASNHSVTTWAWSPTGSAYAVIRDGGLTIVGRDGNVAERVDQLTNLESLQWSPDGSWLSVGYQSHGWLLRSDGTDLKELLGVLSWSADGRTMAVSKEDGTLLVGGSDGSDLHPIGSFPSVIAWSPDGSRFAFIRDGNAWTAARAGTDVRNLSSLPLGGASDVAWSPDGGWIAVAAAHGTWVMRPDGSARRWIDLGLTSYVYRIVWAPGGRRLAVETYSDSVGAASQTHGVYLVNADNSRTIEIDDASTPSWSPDGRFLVVGTRMGTVGVPDFGYLELLNEDGSGPHELMTAAGIDQTIWVR